MALPTRLLLVLAASAAALEGGLTRSCPHLRRCLGCGGEQCQLCLQEEGARCCLEKGVSRAECCAGVNPQLLFREVCQDPCGAERPTAQQRLRCCVSKSSLAQCCAEGNHTARECSGVAATTTTTTTSYDCDPNGQCFGCHGATLEQCDMCHEEVEVRCCLHRGGSLEHCCAKTHPRNGECLALGRALCSHERCLGCSGEQCQTCREEEDVKCCLRDQHAMNRSPKAGLEHCCANVSPETKALAVCQPCNLQVCDPIQERAGDNHTMWERYMTCFRAERARCCVNQGGSPEECCFRGDDGPGCSDCDLSKCHGLDQGEPAALLRFVGCIQEEQLQCCLRRGDTKDWCCSRSSEEVRAGPLCTAGEKPILQ